MRIAFDHQIFALQRHGGISRYFVELSQALHKLDTSVRVLAPFNQNAYLSKLSPPLHKGIHLRGLASKIPGLNSLGFHINSALSPALVDAFQPDILHLTYYRPNKALLNKELPLVVTVYDMIHEIFPQFFSRNDKTILQKKVLLHRADRVICISETTRRDLLNILAIPESKISVIHLGCLKLDEDELKPPNSFELPVTPFLLYVGNRYGYKNFSGLVAAIATCKKLSRDFSLIAFGGEELSQTEMKAINSISRKGPVVRFMRGSDHLLSALYQRATAFVYPSLYEGFGLPPLEAMANRCPVISSTGGSMPEILGDACHYFNPLDPEDLTEAIREVVYSPTRLADLKTLGEKQSLKYNWKHCAELTLQLYHSLTEQR